MAQSLRERGEPAKLVRHAEAVRSDLGGGDQVPLVVLDKGRQNHGGYRQLNMLHEYGLITADYNSYMGYEMCIANEGNFVAFGFLHQGSEWGLVPPEDRAQDAKLLINGVGLSQAGRELLKIVDLEPVDSYTADLRDYFEKNKLKLMSVLRQTGT